MGVPDLRYGEKCRAYTGYLRFRTRESCDVQPNRQEAEHDAPKLGNPKNSLELLSPAK